MKWLLGFLAGLILFYLSVYPMLAMQIYSPIWYELNCKLHDRCVILGEDKAHQATQELTQYWSHQGELGTSWTLKEKSHLAEVRPMFDALFIGFITAALLALLLFKRERLHRAALVNAIAVLSLLLILPFFKYFWVEIFHPLLFDNLNWKNNRDDVSWYLMPKPLFMLSLGTLVIWTCLVNLSVWWWTRQR